MERSTAMRQAPPPLTRERVLQLIQRMKSTRVAVLGDIMLDGYSVGASGPLAADGPVGVRTVAERDAALGGGANVAATVGALGRNRAVVGAAGGDVEGSAIREAVGVAGFAD